MKWEHRVDPEWLAERKKYLSASDVKKLIPVTASGRPRANMEEAFLKVWAEKQCAISEDDVASFGAMARGHLLEPYGIVEFNKLKVFPILLNHWDDVLVHSPDGMSCSPDALSIQQPEGCPVSIERADATYLGEVKAYTGANHYLYGLADKMCLEERWQIATAFHVISTLKKAALIFFNPSAEHPLFYHVYTRSNLASEIDLVEKVIEEYQIHSTVFDILSDEKCDSLTRMGCISEQAIIEHLLEEMEPISGLNP